MSKKSKIRQNYNPDILEIIKERYGFSIDYIRKSLRGDRVGLLPEKIKKEYLDFDNESKKALNEACQRI